MKKNRADQRVKIGRLGEQKAREHLLSQGYTILQQNWRCRSGEIDIIAQYHDIVIFVEVRSRSSMSSYGTAGESVNYRKQKQVRDLSQVFLHQTHRHESLLRFDVITVLFQDNENTFSIDHICNAF